MWLYRAAAAGLLAARAAAVDDFSQQVEEILARPGLAGADVGIDVRILESGKQIYKHDETLALTPASNQKLLISTLALSNLGLDFAYSTTVCGSSAIGEDGVLDGDLWIVGSGDPSLTSKKLAGLAEDFVKETGLKKISGSVYGDGSIFDDAFIGEGWDDDDLSFSYSPEIAGLNCDLNVIDVTIAPGDKAGDSPAISVNGLSEEEEKYVSIESTVKTTEGGQAGIDFARLKDTNTIELSGSVPVGSEPTSVTVTIHDPIAFTAYRFALALNDAGVEVSTEPTESGKLPECSPKLASSTSDPLSELLASFLKPSDNLHGEAFLKTVGHASNPEEPGSAASGAKAVQAFLEKEGIDATGVETVDGSGLSSQNTLTARFIDDLLVRNKKAFSEEEWTTYFDALPTGGVDGTIADRFLDSPAKGKVHAKTGTLNGVSALSGYLEGGDETMYVFSILMNGFEASSEARQGQDDIVTALYVSTAE